MKNLKEKKGFTLIELLAVIVILAIVSVIGATTVLPYIQNATGRAFAVEANHAKDAASNAVALDNIGALKDNITGYTGGETDKYTYCFTLKQLVDAELWTKDSAEVGTGKYEGTVKVVKESSGAYTYTVSMTDGTNCVKEGSGNVTKDDVEKCGATAVKTTCSAWNTTSEPSGE